MLTFSQADAVEKYFKEEVGEDLPIEIWDQLNKLRNNVQHN